MREADYTSDSLDWREACVDCRDLLATAQLYAKAQNAGKLQKKNIGRLTLDANVLPGALLWISGSDASRISWAVRAANCSHCVAADCAFGGSWLRCDCKLSWMKF